MSKRRLDNYRKRKIKRKTKQRKEAIKTKGRKNNFGVLSFQFSNRNQSSAGPSDDPVYLEVITAREHYPVYIMLISGHECIAPFRIKGISLLKK